MPPTDLFRFDEDALSGGMLGVDPSDPARGLLLGPLSDRPRPARFSPPRVPPLLLLHGDADLLIAPARRRRPHDSLVPRAPNPICCWCTAPTTAFSTPAGPARELNPLDFLSRLGAGDSSGRPLGFLLHPRPPRPGGRPLTSYTVSTSRRRHPGGQDVARRVHVAVMHRAAVVAHPLADVQRQLRADRPAGPAQLAAGEPSVDHNEFTPIPGEFERPAQRAFAQALQGQLPHVGAASGVRQAGADRSQLPYPVAFASHRPAPSPGVGRPDDWSADPSVCPSSGDAEAF